MSDFQSDSEIFQKLRYVDIGAVLGLHGQAGLELWSEQSYGEILENPDYLCLGCFFENKLSAFIITRLIKSDNILEIINIGVGTELRRRGIGRRLLDEVRQRVERFDLHKVFLEVRKGNRTARAFYEKYGFVVVGERKNFYEKPTEDAEILCLNLKTT